MKYKKRYKRKYRRNIDEPLLMAKEQFKIDPSEENLNRINGILENLELPILTMTSVWKFVHEETLQAAKEKFMITPNIENLENLNQVRKIVQIGELPGLASAWAYVHEPSVEIPNDIRKGLEWGYKRPLPWNVEVAWGARAILTGRIPDLVWDRSSMIGSQENRDRLAAVLDGNPRGRGLLHTALLESTRLYDHYVLQGDEDKEHLLAEEDGVVILGNTLRSHGHYYLIAFPKPIGWVGPSIYKEPPPPPPPPPMAPQHVWRLYNTILMHRRPEDIEIPIISTIIVSAKTNLKAKTGAKTPKAFFGWLMKQRLKPEIRSTFEEALKKQNIKYKN